jgi:hypothetical protein
MIHTGGTWRRFELLTQLEAEILSIVRLSEYRRVDKDQAD